MWGYLTDFIYVEYMNHLRHLGHREREGGGGGEDLSSVSSVIWDLIFYSREEVQFSKA